MSAPLCFFKSLTNTSDGRKGTIKLHRGLDTAFLDCQIFLLFCPVILLSLVTLFSKLAEKKKSLLISPLVTTMYFQTSDLLIQDSPVQSAVTKLP